MKKLYVVAKNNREFNKFRACVSASTFYQPVYVHHPDVLRGVHKEAYTYVGKWYERKGLGTIQQLLVAGECYFVAASAIVPAAHEYWKENEANSNLEETDDE